MQESMIRTQLHLSIEIINGLEKELDLMNKGFTEKPWDRSKLVRSILRNYLFKIEKDNRLTKGVNQ